MEKFYIVWNGCDGYEMANEGDVVYTRCEHFDAFAVYYELTEDDIAFYITHDDELFHGKQVFVTRDFRYFAL